MVALVAEVLLGEGFDDGDSAGGRHLFFLPERQSEGKVFLCQWFVAVKIKKKEYYI